MTNKERNEQKQKLIANLDFCKAEMKKAQTEGDNEKLSECKQNYYRTLAELDKLQPKSKN